MKHLRARTTRRVRRPTALRTQQVARMFLAVAAMVLLMSWSFQTRVHASAGDLDPSFGEDGKITTNFSGYYWAVVNAIAVQHDGKVVAAGYAQGDRWESEDFVVARYNADGTPDKTFGSAVPRPTMGWVSTDFFGNADRITSMSLLPGGKIVVAGHAFRDRSVYGDQGGYRLAVARYNSNGTLDTTFGSDGKVTTDFIGDNRADALAVLDNGKVLVAGPAWNIASGDHDFSIVRFNSDGSLDESFGDNGRVVTEMGSDAYAHDIGVQSSGKIVVGGEVRGGASPDFALTDFALARYKSNGQLDKSFGTDGKVITDFSGYWDIGYSLSIQPDDKILVAGSARLSNGRSNFALARYEANGTLDQTFGTGGKVQTDFGYDSLAYAMTCTGPLELDRI